MRKTLNIILKTTTTILLIGIAALAFLMAGIRLFGIQVFTVLSPSMTPNYPTGALVYVKEIDPADLRVNDVITFKLDGDTTATHRIVEIVPAESSSASPTFRTKGDSNKYADSSPVTYNDIIGKVIFCIPCLGYIVSYIQQPPGIYISIGVGAVIIHLMFLSECISDDKKKKSSDNI